MNERTDFVLVKDMTDLEKAQLVTDKIFEKKKMKSLRNLALSTVPLAFRIGIRLATGM